jgi:hypothetical protein
MIRASSIALGIGLVVLWLVGLWNGATAWLTWLNGVGGLVAFGIAASVTPRVVGAAAGSPIALSVGLFALWIIALITHATTWLTWWTFAFACAFLMVGMAGGYVARPTAPTRLQRV